MNWASSISIAPTLEDAACEAIDLLSARLERRPADLVLAFVSNLYRDEHERLPGLIRRGLGSGVLLGCSGGGVIGGGSEVEHQPALALVGASLPDVEIAPFQIDNADVPSGPDCASELARVLGVAPAEDVHFILLPEPFSFDTEPLLGLLDSYYPGGRTIGGLASGGTGPSENALYVGASMYQRGAVGVALRGNIEVDTVVAQGCRPVGDPMFVTAATGTMVHEIDGRASIDVLRELYVGLDARDKELFRHSLFFGIVMDQQRQQYRRGDFLIRNLLGVDDDTGALSVAATVAERSVVQLHLRDARTSSEDIDEMLAGYSRANEGVRAEGALLFSCLGRGEGLYGRSGHDSDALRRYLGELPLGGFFCNGEIGEVAGRSFVHGYTSSFGLFRAATHA
jgi:small ligand-binding sensory domain FIST